MTTLRDRVREALSAGEPSDAEARKDLESALRRASRPRARRSLLLLAPAVAAIVVLVLVLTRRERGPFGEPRRESSSGVHLYIRAIGEPEDKAIALDLEPEGRQ